MNRQLMKRVAESIRECRELDFHQGVYFRSADDSRTGVPCGCVAGHAAVESLGIDKVKSLILPSGIRDTAQGYLGITLEQADALFASFPNEIELENVFGLAEGLIEKRCRSTRVTSKWMADTLDAIAEHSTEGAK